MLILLPPSETKTAPNTGAAIQLDNLAYPQLRDAREYLMDSLARVSSRPDAATALGLSERLASAIAHNVSLSESPSGNAIDVYTGVLYDAMDAQAWDDTTRARAATRILIFSALFGVVRPFDQIPAYRLSATTQLETIGRPNAYWRAHLADVIDADQLIIDARSAAYQAMWRPRTALPVKVFKDVGGKRSVVSHLAKHARGLVASALAATPDVTKPADAVAAINDRLRAQAGIVAELDGQAINVIEYRDASA